jgi:hypothetical protein
MKCAEVIMVRSTDRNSNLLAATLEELMEDVLREAGDERIRVFRRENIETDYCIVLFHEEKTAKSGGSRLGLRLAAAFKEFGMVHHTVWNEMDQNS